MTMISCSRPARLGFPGGFVDQELVMHAVALCVFVASGCGAPKATVSGRVSFGGKPVTSGDVVFIDATGHATVPASVQADGSYSIREAAVGLMKVSFDNMKPPQLPALDPGSSAAQNPEYKVMAEASKNFTPTPDKFKNPATSGITFELKPGANVCDIDLK